MNRRVALVLAVVCAAQCYASPIWLQKKLPTTSRCQKLCPECTTPDCKCNDSCWPGNSLATTPDKTCACFAQLGFCKAGEEPVYSPGKECPSCWPAENKACMCFAAIGFCEPPPKLPETSRCAQLCPGCDEPTCKCPSSACWPGHGLNQTSDHNCDCFAQLGFCKAGEEPVYSPGKECPSCWPAENKACMCFAALGFCKDTPLSAAVASTKTISLATFDGAKVSTQTWTAVNDPVMGGQSFGTFNTSIARKVALWEGEVKIVPFLHAPGFCNVQAPGSYPDASGMTAITLRARTVGTSLANFNVQLSTKGSHRGFKSASYSANFTLSSEWQDVTVPLTSFACNWRGEPVSWCPSIMSQLSKITQLAVGTAFPGKAGKFNVELESISATA